MFYISKYMGMFYIIDYMGLFFKDIIYDCFRSVFTRASTTSETTWD